MNQGIDLQRKIVCWCCVTAPTYFFKCEENVLLIKPVKFWMKIFKTEQLFLSKINHIFAISIYIWIWAIYYNSSYFLHCNFDWKKCFVVFFLEWKEWKNPQFNFSNQNLSIERNFFKWDGKETKKLHLLFHRIWKIKSNRWKVFEQYKKY